ncbi:MAG TPA: NmrA family NAD(P)-binding protein, partial [Chitinophaga sp.]|uniref:NmrA family NAD(P)-binding protein n=1 Tax=Chitinophaga sp. TaxID=1869181 RepID=UPI002F91F418
MSNILITGATGNIGSELAKQLSALGVPFRAMVRSLKGTEALAALNGVNLVTGDLNDFASLQQALQGIDKAFLLTNSSEQAQTQQLDFVKAAQEAGVQHIVKLSQFAAAKDSPVRFLRYHAVVEEAIQQSGITYTFLRPNLFMQGLLGFRDTIVHKSAFFAAIGNAKISMVDIRDIA